MAYRKRHLIIIIIGIEQRLLFLNKHRIIKHQIERKYSSHLILTGWLVTRGIIESITTEEHLT